MAVDMFLKLEGIKGESQDSKHKDEIDVLSWAWGMRQAGTMARGGGGGSGKVEIQDLNITKTVDKATPSLMLNCCNGKHIKEGFLTVRKAGETPVEYLKITMTDVLISSISSGGHTDADQLTEQLSLNFASFKTDYQPQGPDGKPQGGPVQMGWDIKGNVKY